ncbi:hypothetical protein AK812_SmicGene2597 [Symbiodinium microadriaticum]|uniref:Uncharacterized protein n=1 Tax=Symbiodinium microadriaticum TaxID=2951 RepID=A0A1Q9F189_SYMMI|nr:hypothetical protein AK812_SmicGene2597 [Symbiodinium microadriaticum]
MGDGQPWKGGKGYGRARPNPVPVPQQRFSGTLKICDPRSGSGLIEVDSEFYTAPGTSVPSQVLLASNALDARGLPAESLRDVAVEFQLCRAPGKGYQLQAVRVRPADQALENRQIVSSDLFGGSVARWNASQGWGLIKADASAALPPFVQAKLMQQAQQAASRAAASREEDPQEELIYVRRSDLESGVQLCKGSKVVYKIYVDDKGVGACGVSLA